MGEGEGTVVKKRGKSETNEKPEVRGRNKRLRLHMCSVCNDEGSGLTFDLCTSSLTKKGTQKTLTQ